MMATAAQTRTLRTRVVRKLRTLASKKATWSVAGSLAAHVVVGSAMAFFAYRSLAAKRAREGEPRAAEAPTTTIAIELPGVAEGTLTADREPVPVGEVPSTRGGSRAARIDTGTPGSGGDPVGLRATNLAASDDRTKLDPDLLDRLDRDQVQRMRTSNRRTTHEDRRATTHPMELSFLATGKGEHAERRPDATNDPSRGSMHAAAPSVVGGHVGSNVVDEPSGPALATTSWAGASRPGQLVGSPGLGVREQAPGEDHRSGARIAYARPSVAEGPPTIPGVWNGRPNDTVDSDQEVASTVRSLIHASVAGGNVVGEGTGGSASADSLPAAGGAVGRGSIARPLGAGDGELVDWNTPDPLLVPYFRKLHAKVDPLWANAFPKSAMIELKQGTVILELSIAADGSARVGWPPIRTSGIDEFDRNCADALRRASPFDPLPPTLTATGRTSLRIRAPFVAKNPIIR